MFSTDKNVDTVRELIEALRQYVAFQKDLLQVNAVEKAVRLLTAVVLTAALSFLLLLVVIFLSFAAAWGLCQVVAQPLAFLAVAVAYALLFILVYAKRHAWIERPLVRAFADILTT